MSIAEAIITVGSTVAGSVAIAYTTFYLQGKHRERALFKALYSEIKLNLSVAQQQTKEPDLVFERAPLYAQAYQSVRVTGELLTLPEPVRQRLEGTYELIYTHNRQIPAAMEIIPRSRGLYERAKKIVENLEFLESELPRHIKYLRQ